MALPSSTCTASQQGEQQQAEPLIGENVNSEVAAQAVVALSSMRRDVSPIRLLSQNQSVIPAPEDGMALEPDTGSRVLAVCPQRGHSFVMVVRLRTPWPCLTFLMHVLHRLNCGRCLFDCLPTLRFWVDGRFQ